MVVVMNKKDTDTEIVKVLCLKSIYFLNQLRGLKIIMNLLHVSESKLVSKPEF